MICSRCHDEIDTAYKHGDQCFCSACLLELSHSNYKPNRCSFCGDLITTLLPLTTKDGKSFCSSDCLAKSLGFIVEKVRSKEIADEASKDE